MLDRLMIKPYNNHIKTECRLAAIPLALGARDREFESHHSDH
jgi:hypothetical protein